MSSDALDAKLADLGVERSGPDTPSQVVAVQCHQHHDHDKAHD